MTPAVAALRVRNFRLFVGGQLVSVTGTMLQVTAQAWLVVDELGAGGSGLGLVAACAVFPVLLFSLWGGLVADRFDRRRTMLVIQSWMAAIVGVQAVLVFAGVVELWMVAVLAGALGLGQAAEIPVRQTFVGELVPPSLMRNAIGLNSATFNVGRTMAPAIAGAIIALAGTAWCFAFNALSFVGVIIALLVMRPAEMTHNERLVQERGQIRSGLEYAWRNPVLRAPLVILAICGPMSANWNVVIPLLATDSSGGSPARLAVFTSALGMGSLVAATLGAIRGAHTLRVVYVSAFCLGGCAILAAATASPRVQTAAICGIGFFTVMMVLSANSLLQITATPVMRGRTIALFSLLLVGTGALGAPVLGWLRDTSSARVAAAVAGSAAVLAGIVGRILAGRLQRAQPFHSADGQASRAVRPNGEGDQHSMIGHHETQPLLEQERRGISP